MSDQNQFQLQGYNLLTLLKRLEVATSRLEDITIFQEEATKGIQQDAGQLPQEMAISPQAPASQAVATPTSVSTPSSAPAIVAFDAFVAEYVTPFVALSLEIDPLVFQQAELLAAAFQAQKRFLLIASRAKKPADTDAAYAKVLLPTNSELMAIDDLKERNRGSNFANHLSTVAEGSPGLSWVVVPTPVSFIPEYKDSAQFWSNRVLKEYRDKDAKHVEWVKRFLSIFDGLKAYVKEYHSTGVAWNANGKTLEEVLEASENDSVTSSPPSAGGPPPPPPPPPASVFQASSESSGMGAVFGDLNRGADITAGLKKVDKSQMSHKNPELRAAAKKAVPAPPKKPTSLSSASSAKTPKRQPKKELEGSKWLIEHFEDEHELVIDGEMQQSVFINKCSNVTIQIKGKVNAITVNDCSKIGLVVDSCVSGIDIIKNVKYGVQLMGVVPMINIDQSSDGSIYLNKDSLDCEVFTSQTTSLNINLPPLEDDGDFVEVPVPEQFKHTFQGGKLKSEIVQHIG
ncbi:hypothetical protein BABINDRAFT_159276 [Babjeviella inositovora NRRL Y-12698]|uniref:Adenylyl cyclase-associated protein n=1 Tax=Babjeviella inositovora NRRL Y-12698 TaxID=984486 RepID=A0A1E3QYM0_9ASCO|nr:uncharacterized protein BABINDRAFT_159276 [Babjeviella inositovora NRRL Y-12698]ODQ82763.1 hypothetical protein BABINDRAFT_159276 [Babjeviella inositovora NRRL Y-12698]